MNVLQAACFWLVTIFLAIYFVLDGLNSGIGFWYGLAHKQDRRALLRAVTGLRDASELWLVGAVAVLFVAFPPIRSGALNFILGAVAVALIVRTISGKCLARPLSDARSRICNAGLVIGSVAPVVMLGMVTGAVVRGLPMDDQGRFVLGVSSLINPYAFLMGLAALSMVANHSALYATFRTDAITTDTARKWAKRSWFVYWLLLVGMVALTSAAYEHLLNNFSEAPVLWLVPAAAVLAVWLAGYFNTTHRSAAALAASTMGIFGVATALGVALYPRLLPSSDALEFGLTINEASSPDSILRCVLIVAAIGVPVLLGHVVRAHMLHRPKFIKPRD